MRQPINYMTQVADPFQEAMKVYQVASMVQQNRQQRQQREQQTQQQEQQRQQSLQLQQDLGNLTSLSNPTAKDYANIMTKYPQLSDHFKKSWDILNESQKEQRLGQLSQVHAALENESPEIALDLLNEQEEAALNSGLDDEARKIQTMKKLIEVNPSAAKVSTSLALSAIDPDKFASTFEKLSQNKAYRTLSNKEKKDLGLSINKPFQINKEGKITPIGGAPVEVNVDTKGRFGTIPPGYVVKETDKGYVMEPIPGSPAAQQIKKLSESKFKKGQLEQRATNVVIEDIERLKNKIEDAPWFSPVAGIFSKRFLPEIRQNRIDAEQLKDTIVSNIGFDRLQQMREASPTGGALGQVSERELSNLQSVLGSLSLSQSEDQLILNLNRLNKLYESIMKKANAYPNAKEFGFGTTENTQSDTQNLDFTSIEEADSAGLPSGTIVTINGRRAIIE